MRKILSLAIWLFVLLYLVALAGFIGVLFGYFQFGSPIASLLMPIGMPWSNFLDQLPRTSMLGLGLSLWGALIAPLINLLVLWLARRLLAGKA